VLEPARPRLTILSKEFAMLQSRISRLALAVLVLGGVALAQPKRAASATTAASFCSYTCCVCEFVDDCEDSGAAICQSGCGSGSSWLNGCTDECTNGATLFGCS